MKKYILTWASVILFIPCLTGQSLSSNATVNGLKLGDLVPDIPIENVVNYSDKNTSISKFRGKLLILDFWATWCSPCIASFPKLDSLQKKFDGRIQILPVTREPEKLVADFLTKMSKHLKVVPFSSTNDFRLNNYFKHIYLPHYVWIDQNSRLIAITEGTEVNAINIEKVLDGKGTNFKIKRDVVSSIVNKGGQPLFRPSLETKTDTSSQIEPLNDSVTIKQTLFTKYIDGVLAGTRSDAPNLVIGENLSIESLYRLAFWGTDLKFLNSSGTLLRVEVKDTDLYRRITSRNPDGTRMVQPGNETIEWRKKNAYCYQLIIPEFQQTRKFQTMLQDLNQFFGDIFKIEGVKEKRKTKYLALVRTSDTDKLASKGGQQIDVADKFSLKLQNEKLSSLIGDLAQPLQGFPPIEDETNYSGNIDLKIDCQLSNLDAVNRELTKYDLKLEHKEKEMEIGVIRDKK